MKKIMWRCESTISGFSGCELENSNDLKEVLTFFKPENYGIVVYNNEKILDLEVYGNDINLKKDIENEIKETIRFLNEPRKEVKKPFKRWKRF